MDHSVLMAVVHTLQNLLDTVGGVCLTVELPSDYVLKKFTSSHPVKKSLKLSKNYLIQHLSVLTVIELNALYLKLEIMQKSLKVILIIIFQQL